MNNSMEIVKSESIDEIISDCQQSNELNAIFHNHFLARNYALKIYPNIECIYYKKQLPNNKIEFLFFKGLKNLPGTYQFKFPNKVSDHLEKTLDKLDKKSDADYDIKTHTSLYSGASITAAGVISSVAITGSFLLAIPISIVGVISAAFLTSKIKYSKKYMKSANKSINALNLFATKSSDKNFDEYIIKQVLGYKTNDL